MFILTCLCAFRSIGLFAVTAIFFDVFFGIFQIFVFFFASLINGIFSFSCLFFDCVRSFLNLFTSILDGLFSFVVIALERLQLFTRSVVGGTVVRIFIASGFGFLNGFLLFGNLCVIIFLRLFIGFFVFILLFLQFTACHGGFSNRLVCAHPGYDNAI